MATAKLTILATPKVIRLATANLTILATSKVIQLATARGVLLLGVGVTLLGCAPRESASHRRAPPAAATEKMGGMPITVHPFRHYTAWEEPMSRERVEMHRLQDLVRLHRLGKRKRRIARQLKMSPNTERAYREALVISVN